VVLAFLDRATLRDDRMNADFLKSRRRRREIQTVIFFWIDRSVVEATEFASRTNREKRIFIKTKRINQS
jgi:hypothetical protein